MNVLAVKNLAALFIDKRTLGIHDVVVHKYVFTDGKVSALQVLLRVLDRVGKQAGIDRRILVKTECGNRILNAFTAEQTQEVVFERQEEARCV